MTNLDIQFLDTYKKLDAFLIQAYSTPTGVTAYLEEMEKTPADFSSSISGFKSVYYALKHLRHIRNQIVHENSALGFAQKEDYETLCQVYDMFLQVQDPLALLEKQKQSKKARYKYANPNLDASNKQKKSATKDKQWISWVFGALLLLCLFIWAIAFFLAD